MSNSLKLLQESLSQHDEIDSNIQSLSICLESIENQTSLVTPIGSSVEEAEKLLLHYKVKRKNKVNLPISVLIIIYLSVSLCLFCHPTQLSVLSDIPYFTHSLLILLPKFIPGESIMVPHHHHIFLSLSNSPTTPSLLKWELSCDSSTARILSCIGPFPHTLPLSITYSPRIKSPTPYSRIVFMQSV